MEPDLAFDLIAPDLAEEVRSRTAPVVKVGVDVGQRHDPTAVAVVETQNRGDEDKPVWHYVARAVTRLPLGTSYPTVAARLVEMMVRLPRRVRLEQDVEILVDATGVGLPIVEMLTAEFGGLLKTRPVFFHHGERLNRKPNGELSVGKAYLVSRLQALLQGGRVHLPKNAESEALARELMAYEIRVTEDGSDRYGAFRTGAHDDLVTALALGCLLEPRQGLRVV